MTKPTNYKEDLKHHGWKEVIQQELIALEEHETWVLTQLLEGNKTIDFKWVYKVKLRPDGEVERMKARLVARRDKQIAGKDYKHSFSPVAKFISVRTLVALATSQNWKLHHLDINNAFLHEYLDEEVYMKPPLGHNEEHSGKVCILRKSLYGLKQMEHRVNKVPIARRVSTKQEILFSFSQGLKCKASDGPGIYDLLVSGNDEA